MRPTLALAAAPRFARCLGAFVGKLGIWAGGFVVDHVPQR